MKKFILALVLMSLGCLCPAYLVHAQTSAPMTIRDATKACERDVPDNCVAVTCPKFCNTKRGAAIEKCKADCTTEKRCKLKQMGSGTVDIDNGPLDMDNNDKLMACIAQKRDPEGKKSGRREGNWEDVTTLSMERALGMR